MACKLHIGVFLVYIFFSLMADLSRCFLFMSAFRDKCLGDETGAKKKKKKQKKKKKSGATEAAQDPLAKV